MRVVADFHIHSKYALATSKFMVPEYIAKWAKIKGLDVVGTGDCTHPLWLKELKEKMEPAEEGLYVLKDCHSSDTLAMTEPRFMLTGEVACIYRQADRSRRVHIHFWAPSFEIAEKINKKLEKVGKIYSDGRPIIGMSAKDLAKIIFEVDERCVVAPAHIWTPWFGILGSKSGFDSIEECFEELTEKIFVLETGLSSDPPMNWRLSSLDKYSLISNSDAHSGRNLMREANVFELTELNYEAIVEALKNKKGFKYTVEFYPEEGMYHWDGNRQKGICLAPEETQQLRFRNPSLAKTMTIGVEHRVFELSDRPSFVVKSFEANSGEQYMAGKPIEPPKWGIPYVNLVSLEKIIAEAMNLKIGSKFVEREYYKIIEKCGNEFTVLMDKTFDELVSAGGRRVAEGILRVREGKICIKPGYDGVYGKVQVFENNEEKGRDYIRQMKLF